MNRETEQDQAKSEPVQQDADEFMDTGVLHERPKGKKGDAKTGLQGRRVDREAL